MSRWSLLSLLLGVALLLSAQQVTGAPQTLYVAYEIENIFTIDLTSATFYVDITLSARWDNGSFYYGDLRVSNRAGSPTWTASVANLNSKRFYGPLLFVPDLSKFPFDSQYLEFSMTHPTLNESRLVFEPLRNESYVSDYARLRGWNYANSSLSIESRAEQYAPGRAAYSQIRAYIYVQRTLQGGIQILLSPSFALIMVFVSFWLPIKENITRISMATSALISEVFIHVSLRNSSLLNLNSLVVMDWFMIICYLLILLAILTNVIITVLLRGDESDKRFASSLASRVRYVVWFFGPGAFTFLFFPVKYLWAAFLCIILPTVIALGVRTGIRRFKYERARRRRPRPHPTAAADSDSFDDDEYDPPAPLNEGENDIEMNTKEKALREELGRNQIRLGRISIDSASES